METYTDIASLKTIPGFQSIMKVVVKNLIQTLVEQLTSHTDEECVILTASVQDATLSQFGSQSGQIFLEENEELTSKFVGFCQKRFFQENSLPEEQSSSKTFTSPVQDSTIRQQNPVLKVKPKGKTTRKRKPKEKNVPKKKQKTVATENLYKRKKKKALPVTTTRTEQITSELNLSSLSEQNVSSFSEENIATLNEQNTLTSSKHNTTTSSEQNVSIPSEQNTQTPSEQNTRTTNKQNTSTSEEEINDSIKEEQSDTDNYEYNLDQGLASIVQSTEGIPPIDIRNLKLETVDDIIEIQLADHYNNDGAGDTPAQPSQSLQDSINPDNIPTKAASSSTKTKKKRCKSRAEVQRAYRERLKAKDKEGYYAKERERQKGYYTPKHLLSPKMQEELRTKHREYSRDWRQRKKSGLVRFKLKTSLSEFKDS